MSVSDLIPIVQSLILGFKTFPVSHVGNEKNITFQPIESAAFFKIGTKMSESFDWLSFLESVEALCRQVEHRIQLSDSNTLQDFLFQTSGKTNSMRKVNRSFCCLWSRYFCF